MTNYTKTTDFAAKDSLPSGDSGKIIRGAEFGTEFDNIETAVNSKSNKENPSFTGNITVTGTVDGRDIAADGTKLDTIETSADVTDTANVTAAGAVMDSELTDITAVKALNQGVATTDSPTFAAVTSTGNVTVGGTVDGRDVAADGTKLDTVETNADVTDTTNVTAAGALMDSEVTNLDQVKAFDSADYATAAQGTTADNALPKTGGAMTGAITTNSTFDGRDVATDGTKLDGIEASADVTDTANVTAAGALMDSELTDIAAVKALNQGVATTDSPTFAGATVNGTVEFDGLSGTGAVTVTDILDQDDMSGNSATALATQQSIKSYVDSQVATSDTLAEVLANGNTTGGTDVAFGDSDKALFGAGSDLQIYHDGSNSFVEDTGTGALFAKTNGTGVFLYSGSEALATFNTNGASNLYYDNALKLSTTSTGIDVTGSVSADGLTVSGPSVTATLNASGTNSGLEFTNGSTNTAVRDWSIRSNTEAFGDFIIRRESSYGSGVDTKSMAFASNGDISFYEDTGTTAKFFWDAAAESLGIGTSSPVRPLSVKGSQEQLTLSEGDARGATFDYRSSTGNLNIATNGINARTNPQFTLDLNGNVGIGTDSPTVTNGKGLHLANSAGPATRLHITDNTTGETSSDGTELLVSGGDFYIDQKEAKSIIAYTNGSERMRIDSSGNVGIGATSLSNKLTVNGDQVLLASGELKFADAGNNAVGIIRNSASAGTSQLEFLTASTERMRIDASGNLLVGTTDTTLLNNTSGGGFSVSSNGFTQIAKQGVDSADPVLILNQTGLDGEIQRFYKDGTTVGSIAYSSGNFRLDGSGLGLHLNGSSNVIYPSNGAGSLNDGVVSLGLSSSRFKDLYLSGKTYLNTSSGAQLVFQTDATRGFIGTSTSHALVLETAGTERARIDSSGNLLVGTTASTGYGLHEIRGDNSSGGTAVLTIYNSNAADTATAANLLKNSATTTSSQRFMQFYCNAGLTAMGGIVGNGASNIQFATISDAREKTNIEGISGSLDKINALNPVEFDWIASGEHVNAGFVAQEVEQVFPEFVVENMASEGEEERKGLTGGMTGGIVAHLVKAIQEQNELINDLRARVAQLETN